MCDISAILGIAQMGLSMAQEGARIAEENRARKANRISARADYNRQIEENQRNYRSESKATQQKKFDETLKQRSLMSRARADAATQGAAGVSVAAVFNEIMGVGARSIDRFADEQEVNTVNYLNNQDTAYTEVRTRLNQNRPVGGGVGFAY